MVQTNCLKKSKVIIIVGPTASGKTSLGVRLAKKFNGEIISADSMQIYKNMDIGTAKVTKSEMAGVPHHLIDIVEPTEKYNVSCWVDAANEKISEIIKRGKTPIIVGGTGLYVTSLVKGYTFGAAPENAELRAHYNEILLREGADKIYLELQNKAPMVAKKIDKTKPKAIIRALEVIEQNPGALESEIKNTKFGYDYILIGLDHDRDILYNRINERVDQMISDGLEAEFDTLVNNYGLTKNHQSAGAIGYKELFDLASGHTSREETIALIKQHSRNYAKRQLTWMRKMDNIIWLSPITQYNEIEQRVKSFLGE